MESTNMRISILMPVYNCPPDLLEKALQSVFDQTFKDWEIVDKDGNPDQPAITTENSKPYHGT